MARKSALMRIVTFKGDTEVQFTISYNECNRSIDQSELYNVIEEYEITKGWYFGD